MLKIIYTTFAAVSLALISLPAQAQGNGATVVREFGCFLASQDSGLPIDIFTDEKTHSVSTPSGNSVLKCHFVVPEGFEPQSAINRAGFPCGTFLGLTFDSKSVVTPGGKAHLTCQVKGQ